MTSKKYGVDYSIEIKSVRDYDGNGLLTFNCGNAAINNFLRRECLESNKDATYIFIDKDSKDIIGFTSLRCASISGEDEENNYINRPAIEIDFFAIDDRYKSIPADSESGRYETLSQVLFIMVINYIYYLTSMVGAEYICLYAVPKAVNFYKRCNFVMFDEWMDEKRESFVKGCVPMYLRI